ncbi:MAG: rhodanese-like domain-containing protein [Gammaproteobacteria bacterium]|nr:rhodanese-like domain-containing protein [Gammaproteobacteria bacterium]
MGQFLEFIVNHWILSSLFVFILMMLTMDGIRGKLLGFGEIKPDEAVRMMNHDDAAVLDVREDSEYAEGHIINSIHIPLPLLENRTADLQKYKDRPLLVYCRTGNRSAQAASTLMKQGFSGVKKLSGGMIAWQGANLPVSKS